MAYYYYNYLIYCYETKEWYIGSRSSKERPENDPYMGSGVLLKSKMKAHPEYTWEKTILACHSTQEEAYSCEEALIGDAWKINYPALDGGREGCLNLCSGGEGGQTSLWEDETHRQLISEKTKQSWEDSPERLLVLKKRLKEYHLDEKNRNFMGAWHKERMENCPEYREQVIKNYKDWLYNTEQGQDFRERTSERSKALWRDPEFKNKMSQKKKDQWADPEWRASNIEKLKRTHVKVISPEGEVEEVLRDDIKSYLLNDYKFALKSVRVKSLELEINMCLSPNTAAELLLSDERFCLGRDRSYKKIKISDYRRLYKREEE